MNVLDRLQRRLGRYALPNLTAILIAGQVLVYLLSLGRPQLVERIALVPALVLQGEIWRLVSFVFLPPPMRLIFAFFFWYLFYLMGTTLEHTWGTFRYNVFLLAGYVATVAVSFITPEQAASVTFLQGSVFLAFAYLYPEFQLLLFFLLPVKIKWLALLAWIGYFLVLVSGAWTMRLMVAASLFNFFLFFGRDILMRMRGARRRMAQQTGEIRSHSTPRHRCTICGITNLTDPDMDFRYCSKCVGSPCYCQEHIKNHEHITPVDSEKTQS